MRFSSISLRTKSKSVCEADGKPTSISLKPISTSISKNSVFCSMLIGSISDWLPSRRSVLIQIGARSTVRVGHLRPFKRMAGKGRYFSAGLRNMTSLVLHGVVCDGGRQRAVGGLATEHDARNFTRTGGNLGREEDGHGDGGNRR